MKTSATRWAVLPYPLDPKIEPPRIRPRIGHEFLQRIDRKILLDET